MRLHTKAARRHARRRDALLSTLAADWYTADGRCCACRAWVIRVVPDDEGYFSIGYHRPECVLVAAEAALDALLGSP